MSELVVGDALDARIYALIKAGLSDEEILKIAVYQKNNKPPHEGELPNRERTRLSQQLDFARWLYANKPHLR